MGEEDEIQEDRVENSGYKGHVLSTCGPTQKSGRSILESKGLCHISELSPSYLAKAEDAFKVGDRVDVKLIEVNEKGQLRLSRRALIPDTDPLVPSTKVRPTTVPKESSGSQDSAAKSAPKNVELTKVKVNASKPTSKEKTQDVYPPGKVVKDAPYINKDRLKKANKAMSNDSDSTVVNNEAKIG